MYVRRVRRAVGSPSSGAIAAIAIILFAQLVRLGVYLNSIEVGLGAFHLYPIVWITVGCWVIWHARPASSSGRRELVAAAIATAYFLVLAGLGGIISPGTALADTSASGGLRITASAPPGYAPAVYYLGSEITISLIPYRLVGYVTLAYLVYVTILDTWAASAPGLLGVFGCIGCSWPIFATLLGGTGGAASAVASAIYLNAYPISTAAFLLAVGLLYWRPSEGWVSWWRAGS